MHIAAAEAADNDAHRQTHRHTKVKTVYPPVSLRSLGGYNYINVIVMSAYDLHSSLSVF